MNQLIWQQPAAGVWEAIASQRKFLVQEVVGTYYAYAGHTQGSFFRVGRAKTLESAQAAAERFQKEFWQ